MTKRPPSPLTIRASKPSRDRKGIPSPFRIAIDADGGVLAHLHPVDKPPGGRGASQNDHPCSMTGLPPILPRLHRGCNLSMRCRCKARLEEILGLWTRKRAPLVSSRGRPWPPRPRAPPRPPRRPGRTMRQAMSPGPPLAGRRCRTREPFQNSEARGETFWEARPLQAACARKAAAPETVPAVWGLATPLCGGRAAKRAPPRCPCFRLAGGLGFASARRAFSMRPAGRQVSTCRSRYPDLRCQGKAGPAPVPTCQNQRNVSMRPSSGLEPECEAHVGHPFLPVTKTLTT